MELTKDISAEQLPLSHGESMASIVHAEEKASLENQVIDEMENLSDAQIAERVETILLERIKQGNKNALFQLGQLYFEQVGHKRPWEASCYGFMLAMTS